MPQLVKSSVNWLIIGYLNQTSVDDKYPLPIIVENKIIDDVDKSVNILPH